VEIHRSAHRHGVTDDDIEHAVEQPVVVMDLDPDADPPNFSSSARIGRATSSK
jgi:hypothetical protein